ncbi:MAG: hypothetical protein RR443_00795 [Anaerorhabdus sp.]|uniref:YciI family protein n=1 Tax=Anaerorhabdus sp. TaxID=1872524 RepID=UPI002FCA6284
MDKSLYVMIIEKGKTYNKLTKAVIERHVANIKRLDDSEILEICGVFKSYPGVAGMYIIRANSYEDAEEICKKEPLVLEGYATYKLKEFIVANRDSNYLL